MTRGAAFDVQAVCSGFIYGLSVADNFIEAAQAKTVLLVGAETMTRLLDWNDRTHLRAVRRRRRRGRAAGGTRARATIADRGVLNTKLFSDGRLHDLLYVDGGPSSTRTTGHLRMQGKEVFRHAVTNISAAIEASVGEAGRDRSPTSTGSCRTRPTSASWTARRASSASRPDKVISTVAEHGNTSAASVPLALVDGGRGRPHQAGRSGPAGGHGRRLHLGRRPDPLVT